MSNIEETAYPRLREDISPHELDQLYTPSARERKFVADAYRRTLPQSCLMLQLKLVQRLGYTVPLASVPLSIVAHVCKKLKVARPTKEVLARYDASGEKTRHQKQVLSALGLRELDQSTRRWMLERAEASARTKQELPDIINALLEELVRQRYLLPGFSHLDRLAQTARDRVNTAIYERTSAALDASKRARLDALLSAGGDKSDWDRLKREPGRPTAREVATFLHHIRWLREQANGLPDLHDVAATKRAQFTLEARALDAAEMRSEPHRLSRRPVGLSQTDMI
jgi:hypothetical protein